MFKVWDLRMLKEIGIYRGYGKDVMEVVWYFMYEVMFILGVFDGFINYWFVGVGEVFYVEIKGGYEVLILSLAWYSVGYIFVSGL